MQSNFPSQPWSTYSSLPLILIGLLFIKQNWQKPKVQLLGFIYIFAAIGSMALHGTFTILGQILDFAGIALVMLWQILWYRNLNTKTFMISFGFLSMLLFAFLSLGEWTRFPAVFIVAIVLLKDLYYFEYKQKNVDQIFLKQAFLMTSVGVILFVVDNQQLWCGPHELTHGHFWWHILVCLSLYKLIHYYTLKANLQDQNNLSTID
jgi:hypothetical protein